MPFLFRLGKRILDTEMFVSHSGFSVIRYVLGGREISHFLQPEGRTFCGVKTQGARWMRCDRFDPAHACKRCAKRVRQGVSRFLTFCPKCFSDFGAKFPLLPNRKCPNCVSVWS